MKFFDKKLSIQIQKLKKQIVDNKKLLDYFMEK